MNSRYAPAAAELCVVTSASSVCVLGPLIEKEFRRTLIASRGDWWVFVDRPLSASILAVSALILLAPLIGYAWRRLRAQPAKNNARRCGRCCCLKVRNQRSVWNYLVPQGLMAALSLA